MTGYARAETQGDYGTLVWELRSVNQRFLDFNLRLPEDFRALEPTLRELTSRALKRGKLDIILRYSPPELSSSEIAVNHDLVNELIRTNDTLGTQLTNARPLSGMDILRWPGVVRQPELDMAPAREAAKTLFATALNDLRSARQDEGTRIATMLTTRCDALDTLAGQVRDALPELQQRQRERAQKRLDELDVNPDPERLEQELALQIMRGDVDEELDRLGSHLTAIRQALSAKDAIGRKLDFLIQECNREANTLGSKAQGLSVSHAAVDMKVLIEQLREQVQNIE